MNRKEFLEILIPYLKEDSFFDDCERLPLKEAREVFEKYYLEKQLSQFSYNISKAALHIGMERSALHRKLKSLGIEVSRDALKNVS